MLITTASTTRSPFPFNSLWYIHNGLLHCVLCGARSYYQNPKMRRQFVTPFLLLCSTFLLSTTLAQHPGIAPTSVNGALPPQATARLDCALNPNSCVDLCYQTNCTNTLGPPPYNVIFSEANNNTATYFEYLKASGSIVNTSEDTEDPCGQWSPWGEGQETVMEGNALLTQITLTFARLLPNSLIHRCASPNDVNSISTCFPSGPSQC